MIRLPATIAVGEMIWKVQVVDLPFILVAVVLATVREVSSTVLVRVSAVDEEYSMR